MKNKIQWLKILSTNNTPKEKIEKIIGLYKIENNNENNLLSEISPYYGVSIPLPISEEDIKSIFSTKFYKKITTKQAIKLINQWEKEMQKEITIINKRIQELKNSIKIKKNKK